MTAYITYDRTTSLYDSLHHFMTELRHFMTAYITL